MKRKKLFGIITFSIAVVFTAIALNVTFSSKSSDLTDVALVNVEALAMNESGNCSCTGPKYPSTSGAIFCRCTGTDCCKDDHGCD